MIVAMTGDVIAPKLQFDHPGTPRTLSPVLISGQVKERHVIRSALRHGKGLVCLASHVFVPYGLARLAERSMAARTLQTRTGENVFLGGIKNVLATDRAVHEVEGRQQPGMLPFLHIWFTQNQLRNSVWNLQGFLFGVDLAARTRYRETHGSKVRRNGLDIL